MAVRMVSKPRMETSHVCKEKILRPFRRVTKIGMMARCLFLQGAPFVKNSNVVPVSAMASEGPTSMPKAWWCVLSHIKDVFDVMIVTSSSSFDAVAINILGGVQ